MAYRGTKCLSGHNRYRKLYELKFYHTTDARDAPNILHTPSRIKIMQAEKKDILQEHVDRQTDRWIDKHLSVHRERESKHQLDRINMSNKEGRACKSHLPQNL